jgi:hypothetical protein
VKDNSQPQYIISPAAISNDMADLLVKAIYEGQANLSASNASIQKIKKGWNLL